MSLSPQQLFGRFHELKKWQETHEKLLKRSSFDENNDNSQNSGENVRVMSSGGQELSNLEVNPNPLVLDQEFEELLEKKLKEYKESTQKCSENNETRPKKPFLRKGAGLSKFNLKPEEYKEMIGNKHSNSIGPRKPRSKLTSQVSPANIKVAQPEKAFKNTKITLNKSRKPTTSQRPKTSPGNAANQHLPTVKQKTTPESRPVELSKKLDENIQMKLRKNPTESSPNSHKDRWVSDLPSRPISAPQNSLKLHDFLESITKKTAEENVQFSPLTAPELAIKPKGNWCNFPSENMNKFTDNLQRNVNIINQHVIVQSWNNSPSSNRKNTNMVGNEIEPVQDHADQSGARKSLSYEENDTSLYEKALETEMRIFEALEKRMEQSGFCSTNTSIIQLLASTPSKFNVRKEEAIAKIQNQEEIDHHPVKDDNKYTQIKESIQEQEPKERSFSTSESSQSELVQMSELTDDEDEEEDVLTSFPEHRNLTENCSYCGALIQDKIAECETELNNLKIEKERIVSLRERMIQDRKEFEKEMNEKRREFEDQRRELFNEIEEQKQMVIEKQNNLEKLKPKLQRREKEEISNLKMELNETKELMKLRETKNATSLARLRNQIKNLEKSNAELKAENEKLLKEKSKLVAQKTQNKLSETKMLQKISKDINKLTEETFKNQHFKQDTSSEENEKSSVKCKGDFSQNKSKNCKNVNFKCNGKGDQVSEKSENIEEIYKSLFGGNDAIIEETPKVSEHLKPVTNLSKIERILEDGTREIKYSNGNIKLISENGTIRYYYATNDTWHTNFPDGAEVIEFPNGQSEKRFKDGKCVVFFPDGLIQTIFPDGSEEVKYPDGSKLLTKKNGDKMLFLTNGQVEIHTKDQKRREYPDGTVKILYPDGSQETRYSNGRIRKKDSNGEIILDTGDPDND